MHAAPTVTFRVAREPWEIEQIHRLNYRTFVEEIPQHPPNADRRLIDRFHAENTYIVGLACEQVVAMIALRGRRPFSLDAKLADLDRHLPPGRRIVEIRLLAVEPAFRRSAVFHGLMTAAVRQCLADSYDLAIISGTTRQLRLYRHLGFCPFGPLVGTAGASFQPMLLTLEAFVQQAEATPSLRELPLPPAAGEPLNFLPGPVPVAASVREAFSRPPVSHRGREFQDRFLQLRARLARFAGARHAQILLGSGSLGTDCVAAQLSLLRQPGVIASCGEFGERLAAHAQRFGIEFSWLHRAWGHVFTAGELERELRLNPRATWLWLVHHETSTGVLHDLDAFKALAARRGLRLCVDCVSSLGTVPLDLEGVWLATGASGKGLAALPGLALVFHADAVRVASGLPAYLDLGVWDAAGGVPFTHSSNLVAALEVALANAEHEGTARFERLARLGAWLRGRLRELGGVLVAPEEHASPAVITIALPAAISAATVGEQLERAGFLLSHRSRYLAERNWIQIALMGEVSRHSCERLLGALAAFEISGEAPHRTQRAPTWEDSIARGQRGAASLSNPSAAVAS